MTTDTKVAHTPGPWGYEKCSGNHEWEIAPAADIAESNWSREVAMTASGNEADARLIAAAPDLLAACKSVAGVYADDTEDVPLFVRKARAAIAKAEGV